MTARVWVLQEPEVKARRQDAVPVIRVKPKRKVSKAKPSSAAARSRSRQLDSFLNGEREHARGRPVLVERADGIEGIICPSGGAVTRLDLGVSKRPGFADVVCDQRPTVAGGELDQVTGRPGAASVTRAMG